MPEIERNLYDLSHFVHTCGQIGRLQTLAQYPTAPGDSFSITLDGIVRLTALRKEVVQEAQVDVFAFWVPHRHIYGSTNWGTLVQEGIEANLAGLPTTSLPGGYRDASYLLQPYAPAALSAWVLRGYNQIWDRYFRVPSLSRDANYDLYPSSGIQEDIDWRAYGRRCARLQHPTNLGLKVQSSGPRQPWRDLTSADWTYDIPVSGGNANLDLRSLDAIKGRYRSEIETNWFTDRYTDVLERKWGTSVNIDADERPELLWRETLRLGGSDVDGTDDATLGQWTGKTLAGIRVDIPRRFFAEHGTIWVMALVRWPLIHVAEIHPLTQPVNFTSAKVLADPDVFMTRAPVPVETQEYIAPPFSTPGTVANMQQAFGNWYRVHPNTVHKNFADIPGYPMSKYNFAPLTAEFSNWYSSTGEFNDVFQTSQLAHWQIHSRMDVKALRYIPDSRNSIFAGSE